MTTIQETLNALDEVKKAINDAYESGYSNGRQHTWVGLTEEEIEQVFKEHAGYGGDDFISFARAIEAKLKEKNSD